MNKPLTDYLINPETRILLPAKKIEYDTIAFEQDKQLLVKKTAFRLIEEACIKYGATYDGRRKAAMHRTGYKNKVPIPISISRGIYVFPTHSPSDYDCAWIFSKHIRDIKRIPPTNQDAREKTTILFNNNLEFTLDVSHHTIKRQMDRADMCKFIFTDGVWY